MAGCEHQDLWGEAGGIFILDKDLILEKPVVAVDHFTGKPWHYQ